MRVLSAGNGAILVELDPATPEPGPHDSATSTPAGSDPAPVALYRALTRDPPPGALECVPAARTVLVRFDPTLTTPSTLIDRITHRAATLTPADTRPDAADADVLEIPVRYDGADLDEVARMTGLSTSEVVARHRGGLYTVAFCGFAPGFGYLTGLDHALRLPRRALPRTRVPAGSVAMADRYTAVYPHPSPGGWHLLGRTDAPIWDPARRPPALLVPGVRVRFT